MNCEQIQNALGRFHDGELSRAERAVMERHLQGCVRCTAELAVLSELSETARSLSEPESPADLWERIAQRLATAEPRPAASTYTIARFWRVAVVTALLSVAVATSWLARRPKSPSDGSALHQAVIPIVDLGSYLGRDVSLGPGQARRMSPEETAQQVSFRVLTTPELPEGYALEESYLVRIEGCNVVRYKYLRGKDVVLLLQYSQGQPVSHGDRPVVAVERVNGKPVEIIQGEGRLAASWKANGTAVSLVGPRNQAELVRLAAYVDQQLSEGKK